MDAYQRGVAAILTKIGKDASFALDTKMRGQKGHLGRKVDPILI
jgi:hypothetical protein